MVNKKIIIVNYGNHRVNHSIFPFVLLKFCTVLHAAAAAAAAKSLQSCPTLCDPIEGSPLGSSVSGIL